MYNIMLKIISTSLFVFLSDKTLLFLFGDISRWFQLHFVGNMFICYFSGKNLLQLRNIQPTELIEYNDNTMMCCVITFVLHLYHTLFFKMSTTDFYHHLYFVFLTGILLGIIYPNIYLSLSISTFFISGLPGGIVYFLLCLQKKKLDFKINSKRNTFICRYVYTYSRRYFISYFKLLYIFTFIWFLYTMGVFHNGSIGLY